MGLHGPEEVDAPPSGFILPTKGEVVKEPSKVLLRVGDLMLFDLVSA
jgi:hypothetical protein